MSEHATYMRAWRANRTTAIPHGTDNGYRNYSCRCAPCREAGTKSVRANNQKAHEIHGIERTARQREMNRESQVIAQNSGKMWTSAELEIATARNQNGTYLRTQSEVADKLGRSLSAVQKARDRAKADPKWIRVIGQ